jgi:ubiquinone/menaquinone biosynthesis C-methylase UbiE
MSGRAPSGERRASWDARYEGQHPVWRGLQDLDLDMPAGSLVLELGCGDGKTLRSLLSSGHRAIGLDSSRGALLACARRFPEQQRPWLVRGDLVSLPFATASFDCLLAHHVLEHLYEGERTAAAAEIARVLKPSGRLDLRVFTIQDMRRGKGEEVEACTYLREGIPHHYFTEAEVLGLFPGFIYEAVRTEIKEKRFAGDVHERAVIRARLRSPP